MLETLSNQKKVQTKIGISALQNNNTASNFNIDNKPVRLTSLPTNISTIAYKLRQDPQTQLLTAKSSNTEVTKIERVVEDKQLVKSLQHKHQTGVTVVQNQNENIQLTSGVTMLTRLGGQQRHQPISQPYGNGSKQYSLAEYRAMKERAGGLQLQNLQVNSQLNNFKNLASQTPMDQYSDNVKDSYTDQSLFETTTVPQSAPNQYAKNNVYGTPHSSKLHNGNLLSRRSEAEVIHKVSSAAAINLLVGSNPQVSQNPNNKLTSFLPLRKNSFKTRGSSLDNYPQQQYDQFNSYILSNMHNQQQQAPSQRNYRAMASFNSKRVAPLILSASNNLTKKTVSNRIRK